jgi:tRNA 2-thiouridine synthesizing protein A
MLEMCILGESSATMAAMNTDYDIVLDTSGLLCPEPVMMLHNAVRNIGVGEVVKVIATDPSTTRDIPKFCNFLNHQLVAQQEAGDSYLYFIRKGRL